MPLGARLLAELDLDRDLDCGPAHGAQSSSSSNNFARGCSWSPDGSCLLTAADDNTLRLLNTPDAAFALGAPEHSSSSSSGGSGERTGEQQSAAEKEEEDDQDEDEDKKALDAPGSDASAAPAHGPGPCAWACALRVREGAPVYDYAWAPFMRSDEPDTCVFASASRDHPVHLWDAYSGRLRGTFQCIDQYDAVAAAHSLAFAEGGAALLGGGGGGGQLHVFRLDRPGRALAVRRLEGLAGAVSRLAVHDASGVVACAGACVVTAGDAPTLLRLDSRPA